MQTILGANGTIASELVKELPKYTDKIRLVSRNPKKVNESDETFPADLSDPSQVDQAIAGSSIVYLLVGFEYNIKVWQKNWPALMKATIDACLMHNSKLVFFDNMYLYDEAAIAHMTENSAINPPSKKGKVRMEIAQMIMDAIKNKNLKAMIVRSADFYGPKNDKSFLIEVVYKNFQKGKAANWFLDLNKKHSFTYTPDAAKATAILANTESAYNQVWHLPTDPNPITGKEMIALFANEMKVKNKAQVLPMWMIKLIGLFIPFMKEMPEMMYQYKNDYFFDSSKFSKAFEFKTTSYAQGVKETVNTI